MSFSPVHSASTPVTIPETQSAEVVLTGVPCLASVYVGACIYMSASGVAQNAIATSLATSNVLGIVQSKPSSTTCDVRVIGVTPEIFASLDVTKEYFLSDSIAGGIQDTPPTTSGHVMLRIGQPYSTDRMFVIKGLRTVRG